MALLLTSGLLVRSLMRLMSDDHGFQPDRVLTVRLPTGAWQGFSRKQTPDEQQRRIRHYLELMHRAEATHGVQAAALASSLPLSNTVVRTHLSAPHQVASAETPTIMPITQAVTRDYFRVMGIPVLSGRTFEARDSGTGLQAIVVNHAFVGQYFKGEDPVGQFLYEPDSKQSMQIIGVVKDSPHLDLAERVEPEIFVNFEQKLLTPFLTGLVIRTRENPQWLGNTLRSALSLRNTDQAVVHVQTLQNLIRENVWQPHFSAWLFSAFATIALCLSGIGVYGVVAYVTTSRRRDYGIRLSLGANPGQLFRLASIQALFPVIAGAALGALGSYWTSRWISSLLYKRAPSTRLRPWPRSPSSFFSLSPRSQLQPFVLLVLTRRSRCAPNDLRTGVAFVALLLENAALWSRSSPVLGFRARSSTLEQNDLSSMMRLVLADVEPFA